MADDKTDGTVGSQDMIEPSRPLLRLLRSYTAKVEAVHHAESTYHDVMLTESLRHNGKTKRAFSKRINAAFDALVDAVVDLQGAQVAVLSRAADEGMAPETVCALDETFQSANREYADYLAARTYEQVREAAKRGALRQRAG
jgi:hypothetical protein